MSILFFSLFLRVKASGKGKERKKSEVKKEEGEGRVGLGS